MKSVFALCELSVSVSAGRYGEKLKNSEMPELDVFFLKNDLKIVSERDNFNAVFSGYGISVTVVHYENGTSALTVNGKEQLLCPALTRSYLLYRAEPDGLKEIGKSMEMEGCGRKK